MKINRNNYEAFFIDYLEGKLDEKLVDDFIEFLQQNTDLKEELSMFEAVSVHPENTTFSKKDKLYKEPFDLENEFNRAAVAKLEGDLTEPERTDFETYLAKYPKKQKEAELFNKTKLIPDESIHFNKKNKLYHKPVGKTILLWSVRIAAVVVLALVFYILSDRSGNKITDENKMAQVERESPKIETEQKIEQIQQVPIKTEEKKDSVLSEKNVKSNPEIKKTETKPKPVKNLRENNKGRIESDDLVRERVPVTVPEKIGSLTASLEIPEQQVSLATMSLKSVEIEKSVGDERLLADMVKEKTGIGNLSLDKIKRFGLNLVAGFTKDNFSYEITEEGRISEISYESRLLAFTIPTNNEIEGK